MKPTYFRFFGVVALLVIFSSCKIIPTISRTTLMKDIQPKTLTVSAGIEQSGESPTYLPDPLFGYVGYAPNDWIELGLGTHYATYLPAIEAKFDVLSFMDLTTPFSLLIMGGVGAFLGEGDGEESIMPAYFHGGLALNYTINKYIQLYAGAGSDIFSKALNLQVGGYISPFSWLGLSANAKFVAGGEGSTLMFSIAPALTFNLGGSE